ncbi:hypothetical protein Pelo_7878 [Pelomyxa schiedti]|nr:hypothetical protein Pelo_7878 [Pelomyxa schiedti]
MPTPHWIPKLAFVRCKSELPCDPQLFVLHGAGEINDIHCAASWRFVKNSQCVITNEHHLHNLPGYRHFRVSYHSLLNLTKIPQCQSTGCTSAPTNQVTPEIFVNHNPPPFCSPCGTKDRASPIHTSHDVGAHYTASVVQNQFP